MDKDLLLFYQNHVFDSIDLDKWHKYQPLHYYVDKGGEIVAVLTIIKRIPETIPRSGGHEGVTVPIDHIWLCGVRDDQRGKGLFAGLIKHFKENCSDVISVATYPKKWVSMYAWIQKKGGKLIHECHDRKCVFTILKKDL